MAIERRRALAVAALGLFFAGCAALPDTPVRPPPGLLVTSVSAPLTLDFKETEVGSRQGQSSCVFLREPFFGLSVEFGKAGIEDAAAAGFLKRITYADCEILQVLGIVGIYTVTVHGD